MLNLKDFLMPTFLLANNFYTTGHVASTFIKVSRPRQLD